MKGKPDLYAEDGVNVYAGDEFSAHAGRVCKESFDNSAFVEVDDPSGGYFRGSRSFQLHGLPTSFRLSMTSDGNGTKVILNAAAGMYRQAALDLLAMSGTDLTRAYESKSVGILVLFLHIFVIDIPLKIVLSIGFS